jgi:hypothetical protein
MAQNQSKTKSARNTQTNKDSEQKKPSEKQLKGIEKKADSLITIALKVGLAVVLASFLAGFITGILEASSEIVIEYFSIEFFLITVPHVAIFTYLFLKMFSYFGLFEHPGNTSSGRSKKG